MDAHASRTRTGGLVEIDCCHSCGGLYFDRGEIFQISKDIADRLSDFPREAAASGFGGGACPGCGEPLVKLREPNFPSKVEAWQCASCFGIWMGEEDLVAFQRFREEKLALLREEAKKEKVVEPVRKLHIRHHVEAEMKKEFRELGPSLAMLAAPTWMLVGVTLVEAALPLVGEILSRRKGQKPSGGAE